MSPRKLMMIAALFGASAVACGAFGAHALRETLTAARLDTWQTAAHYQLVHAVALAAIAAWWAHKPNAPGLRVAGVAITVGVLVFSGSLYALCLSGVTILGAITPIGGVALIVGWLALLSSVARTP
ncbi:MAG: uncharacterized membrane protein YgdD (TMEM256/DUF423 family) [Bradymonadia bacterium]